MELIQENPQLAAYLAEGEAVDHGHPSIRREVERLGVEAPDAYIYARAAYEFVRDAVPHSQDSGDLRVTWRASDVLALRTGICHAKAHLAAALLRAAGIPTALCYQRLTLGDGPAEGCAVHGLIAVWLDGAWRHQDVRGNKPGVDARFSLGGERLAWIPRKEFSELDYPVLYGEPCAAVLDALKAAPDRPTLWKSLPDAL
ncbi:transglutaminase domain-containing protein [Streptomyces sp. B-S-A8]|uniref:Transglutaminase domain-containing protein n=1 Tax=Streptomyces solicavernae TaxID=3043614 RepID=A0ABT6S1X1_9ACTN|nr:transglutaminase domain-containing protein [Streptomyces sp. B-S-A8]MDI3390692.1 transglutaminase domain-containing protein [Streptomyces sp. B-S-A8]